MPSDAKDESGNFTRSPGEGFECLRESIFAHLRSNFGGFDVDR